jgi:monoterpene epsilon-lactone hydrolase
MNIAKLLVVAFFAMTSSRCFAQVGDAPLSPRQISAKSLPVPTDVSPGMQAIIAAPLRAGWDDLLKTGEEWRVAANAAAAKTIETLPAMRERLHVTVKPSTVNGVRVYVVTPDMIPPEHRDKLLIHIHGGCYELSPGEAGTSEAIMMAGLGHFKVLSVDYRMPPEAYFPGALDDAMTVYQAVLKTSNPKNVAVFGTSAGGALVLEMMLRARQLGLMMPGAIARQGLRCPT